MCLWLKPGAKTEPFLLNSLLSSFPEGNSDEYKTFRRNVYNLLYELHFFMVKLKKENTHTHNQKPSLFSQSSVCTDSVHFHYERAHACFFFVSIMTISDLPWMFNRLHLFGYIYLMWHENHQPDILSLQNWIKISSTNIYSKMRPITLSLFLY